MILGNLFQPKTTTLDKPSAAAAPATGAKIKAGGRLNLKAIPKEAPAKKAAAAPAVKLPSFSFGGAKAQQKQKQQPAAPTAKMINGKMVGYFSEEQVVALYEARREIPSNAPQYWQKVRYSTS